MTTPYDLEIKDIKTMNDLRFWLDEQEKIRRTMMLLYQRHIVCIDDIYEYFSRR